MMKTKTDARQIIFENECKKYGISSEPADLDYGILSSVFHQEDYDPNFCEKIKGRILTNNFNKKKDGKIFDLVERFAVSDFGTPEAEINIIDLTRYANILLRSVARKGKGIEKLFAKNTKKAFENSIKEIVWIAVYSYATGLFLSRKGIFLLITRNTNSDKWNKYLDEIYDIPDYIKDIFRFNNSGTCKYIEDNLDRYSYKSDNNESIYVKLKVQADNDRKNVDESDMIEVAEALTEKIINDSKEQEKSEVVIVSEENKATGPQVPQNNDEDTKIFIITNTNKIKVSLNDIECGFYHDGVFYTDQNYSAILPSNTNKFYLDLSSYKIYRYIDGHYEYLDSITRFNKGEYIKKENDELDKLYREAVYHDKDPVGDILLLPAISSFQQTSEEKDEQKTSTNSVQPVDPNSTTSESAQSNTQTPIQSKEYTIGLNRITKRKNQEKVYSFGDILKLWREGDNS